MMSLACEAYLRHDYSQEIRCSCACFHAMVPQRTGIAALCLRTSSEYSHPRHAKLLLINLAYTIASSLQCCHSEPCIDQLVKFQELQPSYCPLPGPLRQLVAHEVEMERVRRRSEAFATAAATRLVLCCCSSDIFHKCARTT
jgi:hypothetical protein